MNQYYHWLFAFLGHLETVFPPPSGHHAILLTQYGNDMDGWQDRLTLALRLPPNESRIFFLEEVDLDKPISRLAQEIQGLINGND